MASFKKGDLVTIYNKGWQNEPIIEGKARIVGKSPNGSDLYKVRFEGGLGERVLERWVFGGECQSDPDSYIAKAQAEWRAANA